MTTCGVDIEALWHEHREPLVRYVARRVSQKENIEDIVQSVFLRAWAAIYKGGAYADNTQGWLRRIARNLIIDRYRLWENSLNNIELDAPYFADDDRATVGDLWPSDDLQPDELVMQAETINEVREAIQQLTDKQRFVLVRRMEGYRMAEISEEMGSNPGAVKFLHWSANVSLRKRLVGVHDKEAA